VKTGYGHLDATLLFIVKLFVVAIKWLQVHLHSFISENSFVHHL